jgi:hypothetical protein
MGWHGGGWNPVVPHGGGHSPGLQWLTGQLSGEGVFAVEGGLASIRIFVRTRGLTAGSMT